MSKGIAPELFIFVIALLVLTVSQLYSQAHTDVAVTKRGLSETLFVEGTNIMEYLKKSLQQSLKYSYYQASYEISKTGGALQEVPTWRKYEDTSGYPSNFLETLSGRTLEIFKQYVSVLAESGIILGDYTKLTIEKKDDRETVSVLSEKDMEISKSSMFRLVNDADVHVSIPIKALTLFEIGKEEFIDKVPDPINSAIQNAEDKLPATCRRISIPDYCETPPSCDTYYPNSCQTQFETEMMSQISALGGRSDEIKKEVDIKEIKSIHIASGPFATPKGQCCVSGHDEEVCNDVCTGDGEAKECTKECSSVFVCDVFGTQYVNAYCEFEHVGAANAFIKISGESTKYPVYDSIDGTVDLRSIQLNFNVISGNGQKLIQ